MGCEDCEKLGDLCLACARHEAKWRRDAMLKMEQVRDEQNYRFITIKHVGGEVFEGHPVYRIFNNKTQKQLAILSWYQPWEQYVFSSQSECVFNNKCLRDVLAFLGEIE